MKQSGKMTMLPQMTVHMRLHVFIAWTSEPLTVMLASMNPSHYASVRVYSLLCSERELPQKTKTLGFIMPMPIPMPIPMPPVMAFIWIIEFWAPIAGFP
jgi:hypothetical protein